MNQPQTPNQFWGVTIAWPGSREHGAIVLAKTSADAIELAKRAVGKPADALSYTVKYDRFGRAGSPDTLDAEIEWLNNAIKAGIHLHGCKPPPESTKPTQSRLARVLARARRLLDRLYRTGHQ